ncbi:hypothetical protein JZ751_021214 [Albula glossodonta]|uniref:Uncharacterized protein n=1 Tax=Albula glossodonta TaxID=121402 RepID=A0A8T2NSZ1_9TELE|nr:hypothetical protein JZ751_021214 [Albula glossodonta]
MNDRGAGRSGRENKPRRRQTDGQAGMYAQAHASELKRKALHAVALESNARPPSMSFPHPVDAETQTHKIRTDANLHSDGGRILSSCGARLPAICCSRTS